MKRKTIGMIALACAFSISSFAQPGRIVNIDKKFTLGLGVRGGLTFTSLSGEPIQCDIYDGSGMGYVGGLFANMRFGKQDPSDQNELSGKGMFGLEVELNYKAIAAKTLDVNGEDLKLNYFEVPILFQFYPTYRVKNLQNLYIEAGPVIAGTMGDKKPEWLIVNDVQFNTGGLKGYDVKVAVGLGWRHTSGIGANIRYNIGTSKLAKNFPVKTNTLEVALSYKFGNVAGNKKVKNN